MKNRYRWAATLIVILFSLCALPLTAQTVYKDGAYKVTVEDVQGSIVLKVTIQTGRFVRIEVLEGRDALGMDDASLASYIAALIKEQDIYAVDAISGATMGCDLIKKGIYAVLKQAG
ncbi:hypothetical protein MASR2M48_33660 [Spirochaetota bacterium]|jgi:uncharacterized protein with FMN-binding domain